MRLAERIASGPPLLLDGGLGSMLMARGLPSGQPPELWNLERPDEVLAVHSAYVDAGSEAVHANCFGANAIRLAHYSMAGRVEELNHAAVDLARRSGARYVIADIGPTGQYLPPVGNADIGTWKTAFHEQVHALVDAGVDALHVETMSDLKEALIAVDAIQHAAPRTPMLVSLTFEQRPRGFFTVMGNALVSSLAALGMAGAVAVGANCSVTSSAHVALARAAAGKVSTPLVLQPNAGQPRPTPSGVVYGASPEAFADDMLECAEAGARVLGGCCGTTPLFIRALADRLGV